LLLLHRHPRSTLFPYTTLFRSYLDMLERRGAALNIASFVGHSALRSYVMGRAATQRVATDAEIAEMRALVLEAMRAGAIGFSTRDRKSTRLNSSHVSNSYAVSC